MIWIVLGGLLILSAVFVVVVHHLTAPAQRDHDVSRAVLRADAANAADHRAARRAMNDAAGQSWRNLTE